MSWTEQTTVGVSVRVVPATSTTITAVSPDKIGTRTKPEMTFTGGEVTGTTYIAFSLTAGGCTSAMTRLGLTAYSDPSGIFPLGAFITGLSTQTYQICLTVNLGAPSETWVAQVGPQLEVHAGSATSLSAIVPSAISTQIPAVLQVCAWARAWALAWGTMRMMFGSDRACVLLLVCVYKLKSILVFALFPTTQRCRCRRFCRRPTSVLPSTRLAVPTRCSVGRRRRLPTPTPLFSPSRSSSKTPTPSATAWMVRFRDRLLCV